MTANGEASFFCALYREAHEGWLEPTLAGVTQETAEWKPPARLAPIGALYTHVLFSEDALLASFVAGRKPLFADAYAGRTGFASPPPLGVWDEWARTVQVDMEVLRAYAQAVYAQTDAIVAGLSAEDMDRVLDLSAASMGVQPVRSLLMTMISHITVHTGEISAIKGLQDQKGYPF